MDIYVPSSKRAHKQTTITNLPQSLQERTTLVVPPNELGEYEKLWGKLVKVVAPDIPKGIGPARQWICENSPGNKVLMMDDDLVYAVRRTDDPTKFKPAHPSEVEAMVEDIDAQLEEHAAVGTDSREGGNRHTERYTYNTRLLRTLAYRTDVMEREKIRFDQIDVMEDFYVALRLLTAGYPNVRVNWIVQNQNGSGLDGGCSQYRTAEMQAKAAHTLHERFPQFVRVARKQTKSNWCADAEGYRTDVVIQWKKAFDSSNARKEV